MGEQALRCCPRNVRHRLSLRSVLSFAMSRIPANLVEPSPPRQVRSRKWQWIALAVFIIAMLVLAVYLVVS
jgi:cytochrome b561